MKIKWISQQILIFSSLFATVVSCASIPNQFSSVAVEATKEYSVPTETPLSASATVPATLIPTETIERSIDQSTPTITPTVTPNPYITPTTYFNSIYPPDYNPLTGQSAVYPENLLRSPLMVKISNYPREIRPQAGLSKADIVFEYYIGAFMNRFLAVFYGENSEWAGPIRSGRLIDGQLAMNYHSALVYGGADARVNEVLKNPDVLGDKAIDTRVYSKCPPLCGTETHSLDGLYVNTAGMSEDLFNSGYDTQLRALALETLQFSEIFPQEGAIEDVNEIEIIISDLCKSKWVYDENKLRYFRWEEEGDGLDTYVQSIDLMSPDSQISVENVILLFADYVVYDTLFHDIRIHYADGEMPAMFFRDGEMISGYWSGLVKDEPLHFMMENRIEYTLAPGKSWIVFVTEDSVLQQITSGVWRLEFATP